MSINLLAGEQNNPEHKLRNPMGFVPVLSVMDDKGVAHHLGESTAILEWLEEKYPAKPTLPQDFFDRALVRQLIQIINSGIQPLHNLAVLNKACKTEEEKQSWVGLWVNKGLSAYETLVKDCAGKYSLGNMITQADFCLVPQIYTANRYQLDLSPYPTVKRIHDNLNKLDWCQKAHADRFKPT